MLVWDSIGAAHHRLPVPLVGASAACLAQVAHPPFRCSTKCPSQERHCISVRVPFFAQGPGTSGYLTPEPGPVLGPVLMMWAPCFEIHFKATFGPVCRMTETTGRSYNDPHPPARKRQRAEADGGSRFSQEDSSSPYQPKAAERARAAFAPSSSAPGQAKPAERGHAKAAEVAAAKSGQANSADVTGTGEK